MRPRKCCRPYHSRRHTADKATAATSFSLPLMFGIGSSSCLLPSALALLLFAGVAVAAATGETADAASTGSDSNPLQAVVRVSSPPDPCRADPTWHEPSSAFDVNQLCASQSHWTPRGRLWDGKLDRFEFMVLSECVREERDMHLEWWEKQQQQQQQNEGLKDNVKNNPSGGGKNKLRGANSAMAEDAATGDGRDKECRVVRTYPASASSEDGTQTPVLPLAVEIQNAWTEREVAAMNGTATCLRRYHGDSHFQDRHFTGGGNNCTFMAGYLQMLAPGISAHVVNLVRMARVAAKWDQAPMLQFPDPGELGVRTNEHLQYTAGGFVGLHTDDESVYTIVVALSEPDAYEGGEYVLYDADDPTKETIVKLPRLSALVFLSSLTSHGVAPVTSGLREMFAAEFWEEDDVPHTALRPNIQEYHEQVLGEVFDEAQGDL